MATTRPQCKWCLKEFKSTGSLGRHYDIWVYRRGPPPEDDQHTPEAVEEMKILRERVKRRPAFRRAQDRPAIRAQQNRESYARNRTKLQRHSREKRDSLVARHMALYEMEKEGMRRVKNYESFDITPDSVLNFATLVFHFLPPSPDLLAGLVPQDQANPDRCWGIGIPSRREYNALCLLLHPDHNPQLGNAWMQRLTVEWTLWEELEDTEKSKRTMGELGRAFIRQKSKVSLLEPTGPSTISQRIAKWEARIREIRLNHDDEAIRLYDLESEAVRQIMTVFGEDPGEDHDMVDDTEYAFAGANSDGSASNDDE